PSLFVISSNLFGKFNSCVFGIRLGIHRFLNPTDSCLSPVPYPLNTWQRRICSPILKLKSYDPPRSFINSIKNNVSKKRFPYLLIDLFDRIFTLSSVYSILGVPTSCPFLFFTVSSPI